MHSLFQLPPPPSRCLPGCGGPTPHYLCGSTGICSSSDYHQTEEVEGRERHIDPPHCCNQKGREDKKTTHNIQSDMWEETASTDGPRGLYQELELESKKEEGYEGLKKRKSTSTT